MDNSVTGAICYAALLAPMPSAYGVLSTVGLISSTLTAHALGAPQDSIQHGLFGFNGMLCGAAIASFTDSSSGVNALVCHAFLALFTSAFASALSLALASAWLKQFNLPTFTMPFNLATLAVLSAAAGAYASKTTQIGVRLFVLVPGLGSHTTFLHQLAQSTNTTAALSETSLCFNPKLLELSSGRDRLSCIGSVVAAILRGVSQVYFNDHWESGLTLVLAFAICSPIGAMCALVGSAVGLGVGVLLGAAVRWPLGLQRSNWRDGDPRILSLLSKSVHRSRRVRCDQRCSAWDICCIALAYGPHVAVLHSSTSEWCRLSTCLSYQASTRMTKCRRGYL